MESITSIRVIHSYQLEAHMGQWYKAMLHDAIASGKRESLVSETHTYTTRTHSPSSDSRIGPPNNVKG